VNAVAYHYSLSHVCLLSQPVKQLKMQERVAYMYNNVNGLWKYRKCRPQCIKTASRPTVICSLLVAVVYSISSFFK